MSGTDSVAEPEKEGQTGVDEGRRHEVSEAACPLSSSAFAMRFSALRQAVLLPGRQTRGEGATGAKRVWFLLSRGAFAWRWPIVTQAALLSGDSMERGDSGRENTEEEEEGEGSDEEEGSKEGEELGWDEFFTRAYDARGGAARKGDAEATAYGAGTDGDGAMDNGEVKLIRTAGDDGALANQLFVMVILVISMTKIDDQDDGDIDHQNEHLTCTMSI
eukprot:680359-Rhodomonas_salina.1